jgi:hypothetical protein
MSRARDAARRPLVEEPAFDDIAFGDEAIESAPPPSIAEPPPPSRPPGGIAYITVTDAAGRVLFRRPATPQEVDDALRSADNAQSEGESAMDRIAYERLFTELSSGPSVESE